MALDIELELPGIDRTLERVDALADRLERVARAQERIDRNNRGGGPGGGGGGRPPGSGAGSGAGGGAGGPGRPPPRPPFGPHERLRRADQEVRDAINSGDAGRLFDARVNQRRAREAYERERQRLEGGGPPPGGGPGGPGRGLQDVLRRLLGGGIAGQLLQFGKVGLAAVVAVKGIELLGRAAFDAAAKVTDLEQARLTTGGQIGDIARLNSIGGAVGLSAQDTANISRSFADALANNPFARSYFGQVDLQGPTGKLNKAEGLIRAIRTLRSLPEDQAIRAAREGGIEPLLRTRNLSESTVDALERDAKTRSRVEDRGYVQSAQELETASDRLRKNFEMLLMEGVKPLIKPLGQLASWIADRLEQLSNSMQTSQDVADYYQNRAEEKQRRGDYLGAASDFANALKASGGIYSKEEAETARKAKETKESATARATAETAANTSAMVLLLKDMRTVLGGGSAARTAYAGRWRYQTEREAATTAAIRQGAFSF